jgi:PAS domain S-box-containing protein
LLAKPVPPGGREKWPAGFRAALIILKGCNLQRITDMRKKRKAGTAGLGVPAAKRGPVTATVFTVPEGKQTAVKDGTAILDVGKDADAMIRESESRYRSLVELSPDAIIVNRNGKTVLVNSAALRLFGARSKSQLFGKSALDLYHPDYHEIIRERIARLKRGETVQPIEEKIVRLDGSVRDVEVSAAPFKDREGTAIQVILRDITGRKKIEQALRESEQRYRRIVETANEGIATHAPDGTITFVNQSMADMMGYSREEMIGRPSMDFVEEEDWEALIRAREGLKARGGFCKEQKLRRKDGSTLWTLVNAAARRDGAGNFLGYLAMHTDVTERKKAEEVLRASEEKYRKQATELTALNRDLDSFSYSVAHELRNPLNNITAVFKVLEKDYREALGENGVFCIDLIEKNIKRMADVISGLLKLSHIALQNIQTRTINLADLASDVVDQLRQSDTSRRVEITIQKDLITEADESLMKVVLSNLITNAWKYTSRNDAPRIEIGAKPEGETTVFFVKDNGIGFSIKDAERIFLPFQRAHSGSEFKGCGIGLSTVRRIIEKHGGRIWAEGDPGNGATFFFTLPG